MSIYPRIPPSIANLSNRPCALMIAHNELNGEFDRENMRLNGRPIKLNDLMREVNRRRLVGGRVQVLYNPEWRVEL